MNERLKYVYTDVARGLFNVFTVRTFDYGIVSSRVTMLSTKLRLKFIWSLIQSLSLNWIIFPSESLLVADSFPLQAFMVIIQLPFGARISEVAPINYCSELLSSSSNLDQFVNYRSLRMNCKEITCFREYRVTTCGTSTVHLGFCS